MDLSNYKHIKFTIFPNKNLIPINELHFDQVQEFNKIYKWAKKNLLRVSATKKHAIGTAGSDKYRFRYFVVKGNQRFELVILDRQGCYRFLLQNEPGEDNCISGQRACRSFYKFCDKFKIDMTKYITKNGLEIKQQIEAPHLEVLLPIMTCKKLKHIHHIDFRSSYASRIAEEHPELKPMLSEIYRKRKEKDGLYKHVLTNTIGCFQSSYCIDYYTRHKIAPYQFANLAKIAINGTRSMVDKMIEKLRKKGFVPLLSNTDGIWYYGKNGELYHDSNEGDELCNWHHDHIDCDFLMVSTGKYQYVEDGVCTTVVRGLCNLDAKEPDRTKWQFGDILKVDKVLAWKFDDEKGVIKV